MARCPVCLKNMHIFYCFEIELDTCRYCGGLWFDGGEIEKLTTLKNIPKRITHPVAYDFSQRRVEEGSRTCPRCDIILTVKDYNGVSIDVCPECKGMWFDRYELGKAIGMTDDMPRKDFDYEHYQTDVKEYKEIVAEGERRGAVSPLMGGTAGSIPGTPAATPMEVLADEHFARSAFDVILGFLGIRK